MKNKFTIFNNHAKQIIFITIAISILIYPQNIIIADSPISHWYNQEKLSLEDTRHAYRGILAVDAENTIHIAWKADSPYGGSGTDWDVFYRYKKSDKDTWSIPEVVSTESSEDCSCLDLAIGNNGTIHIVWKDRTNYQQSGNDSDIFYKYKEIDKNWSTTEIVSTESTQDCNCPSLAIDNNETIHVAWPDKTNYHSAGRDYDIFYKQKPWGKNWTNTEVASSQSHSDSFDSALAVDTKGIVHLVWQEENLRVTNNICWDIFYKEKQRNEDWTNVQLISEESTDNSVDPSIEIDENNIIYVIWKDRTNYSNSGRDYDVFMKKKINGIWKNTEVISTESKSDINWPSLTIGLNNSIHVAWSDRTTYHETDTNDYDIVYTYKLQTSTIWSPIELVSEESTYTSNWPSLATDTLGGIHVSWWDDINGTWTTYYKERDNKFDTYIQDDTNIDKESDGFTGISILISFLIVCIILLRRRK